MKIILSFVLLLMWTIPTVAQRDSENCLERFDDFETITLDNISPNARLYEGATEVAWLSNGDCLAFTQGGDLWVTSVSNAEQRVKVVTATDLPVSNLTTSPVDGTIAFTTGLANTIFLLKDDLTLVTLTASGAAVTQLAFSADGSYFAVASHDFAGELPNDARLELWNLSEMELIASTMVDAGSIVDLNFMTDNRHLLVSATWDIAVEVSHWNIEPQFNLEWDTSFLSRNLTPPDLPMAVQFATMQDNLLIVVGFDRAEYYDEFFEITAEVWNPLGSDRLGVYQLSTESDVTDYGLRPTDLVSFTNQEVFVVGFSNGTIEFRQTMTGELLASVQSHEFAVSEMHINYDQNLLAIVGRDEQDVVIRIFDVDDLGNLDSVLEITTS